MFSKFLKIAGILALSGLLLFGAVEVWLNRNQEMLFRKVQEAVNENLNGNLEIGDFKFRPFSGGFGLNFTLANVKITDTLYSVHKTAFLDIELIHAALDFNGFYKGDIKIKNLVLQNGSMRMFVRKDGYSNLSIFKSSDSTKKDKSKSGTNDGLVNKFGHVRFINFAVSFLDSTTGKGYGAVFHDASNHVTITDTTTNASFAGSIYFNGLIFKPEKGGFLMKQETNMNLTLAYDSNEKRLTVYPSVLENSAHDKISISGIFDFADTVKTFQLNFEAKKIAVDNALPLLPKVIRQQIDSIGIHTLVDTEVRIVGELSPRKPRVNLHFKTDPFQYDLPVGSLRKVVAEGYYTNQGDTLKTPGPQNARLSAPDVHGFFETIPFKLKLVVNNFINPSANLDGKITGDSTNLDQLLDPSRYRFKNGKAQIDFHFAGSLKKFYDQKRDRFNGKINGKVSLQNISMEYLPRQVSLKKINGELAFNEQAFVFPDLSFSDGQNMLFVQGKVMDLIPYLFGSPKPLRANVNINIPTWKLNWLETLLAPRTNVTSQKKKKLKLADLLDDAIDKIEIIAKLNSAQMKYKKFAASDVKGEFTVKNNSMRIEYFVMKAFKGARVRVSGEMDNSGSNPLPHLALRGKVTNADVQTLFNSFNNFGQQTITDQNLKGRLSTEFNFESRLSNNVKIVPASMRGQLHINLTNGYINNFEPFLKMKKLVFKKRNFESVQFAPITTNFRLNGQEIEIEPMEIESNVVTLFIDGVYSFAKKTDINIEIPLSNLKKRDSTYVLDPNNPEKREGSKIFLKAIDENGEVNIKLAFRKKDRKDKKDKEK
ncbi:AsmA-like C-terminal region-containing protein [Dyadobacter psychrotolerans]|uniref:Uncharacterized protein n=1 Tax=Dyadobacter psychrotolerans TaxID=2541721 RepID=A0A4R5DP27_9BACT|nr:AsmA-like C-terminal region-containing protein [Dyadobacter psychrotolerans]TDE13771.1 hypothetical protein E0F88_17905 [Dyadobacter psychrotolerans]